MYDIISTATIHHYLSQPISTVRSLGKYSYNDIDTHKCANGN